MTEQEWEWEWNTRVEVDATAILTTRMDGSQRLQILGKKLARAIAEADVGCESTAMRGMRSSWEWFVVLW